MRLSVLAATLIVVVLGWPSVAQVQTALLIFDGDDHKTFLGCLNCSQFDGGSVCNEFGPNGSSFSSESIWNQFSTYGSQFSGQSPWNQFSSSGPVIVDRDGKFYGRLTANQFVSDRTRIPGLVKLTDLVANGLNLDAARKMFCGD